MDIEVFLLLHVTWLHLLSMVRLLLLLLGRLILMLLLLDSVLRAGSLPIIPRHLILLSCLFVSLLFGRLLLLIILLVSLISKLNLLLLGGELSILPIDENVTNLLGQLEIDHIVLDKPLDRVTAIVNLRQLDEKWNQVVQLPILRVVVPRDDRHGLLWHQHVS